MNDQLARAAILNVVIVLAVLAIMVLLIAEDVERLKRINAPRLIWVTKKSPPTVEPGAEVSELG